MPFYFITIYIVVYKDNKCDTIANKSAYVEEYYFIFEVV